MSKPTFRPYPEPGSVDKGQFRPLRFLSETIRHGGFHFTTLMPHIVIPIYVAYMVLKRMGVWTDGMDAFVAQLLVPALQGLAVGGILGTSYLRFNQTGRQVKSKRLEGAATDDEDVGQHRIEVSFWAFIYLLVLTIIWTNLPTADGPGFTALKRLGSKVGLDFSPKKPAFELGWKF